MRGEWRSVVGTGGWYDVSDSGRLRSWVIGRRGCKGVRNRRDAPRLLRGQLSHDGYQKYTLCYGINQIPKRMSAHVLVLEAFVGPRSDGQQCRHLNGERDDNRLSNLAWGTIRENTKDRTKHGRQAAENHYGAKLTWIIVRKMRKLAQEGTPIKQLARWANISLSSAYSVVRERTWLEPKIKEI